MAVVEASSNVCSVFFTVILCHAITVQDCRYLSMVITHDLIGLSVITLTLVLGVASEPCWASTTVDAVIIIV